MYKYIFKGLDSIKQNNYWQFFEKNILQLDLTLNKAVSLVAQLVKSLSAMWETWVPFLDQEDPLEKEMATHSSVLAWRIPWTEEPGGLQPMWSQELDTT